MPAPDALLTQQEAKRLLESRDTAGVRGAIDALAAVAGRDASEAERFRRELERRLVALEGSTADSAEMDPAKLAASVPRR